MTFFQTLFRKARKTLQSNPIHRPSTQARLTVEVLEARVVPAVGKWYPVPAPTSLIAPSVMDPIQIQVDGTTLK